MMRRYVLYLLLSFSLTVFVACGGDDESIGAEIQLEEEYPDQISHNFKISFIDSSMVKTRLMAGRGRVFNKKQYTLLDSGVRVLFYSEKNGERISQLTADSAMINDRSKDMYAFGNVVVVSDSTQTTLKTEYLQWKNDSEKIFSDRYVEIDSPQEFVTGVGFESDKKLENYTIYDVSGVQK